MSIREHNPIRVLFVLSTGKAGGGAAQVWVNLLRGLPALGVEPVVVLPNNGDGSLAAEIERMGIVYHELFYTWWVTSDPNPHSAKRKVARRGARYANALAERTVARIVADERIDLVYLCDGTITLGLDAAQRAGIPVVWHFHQFVRGARDGLSFIDSDEEVARQLARAARVVTVTEGQRKDLIARFGVNPECIEAVFNGVSEKHAADKLSILQGEKPVFTLAGRIDANKRQCDAVDAFGMIAAGFPYARLQFVGGGAEPDVAALREHIAASPYASRIEYRGQTNDMRSVWKGTDVALNCSMSEGCSMVVAEAMASGCLVIASSAEGNAELLDPDSCAAGMRKGVHGLLYERGNADELAAQMRWVLEHPEAARVIATQGRVDGRQAFSLEAQLERIRAIFDDVLRCGSTLDFAFADDSEGEDACAPSQETLVSIITPVYNSPDSLRYCTSSLQAQTHANLQIILVDDGSTDSTSSVCDEIAANDPRVHVIHQANGGPGVARNAGLDAVRGEWIMFVDADDTIEPGYVEWMLRVAHKTQADLVVSDCMMHETGSTRRFGMVAADALYAQRDELWQDFLSTRIPWSLWAKLYRAELFNGVRFQAGDYIAEDLDVNARIIAQPSLKLATTRNAGYHYSVTEGSVDHSFTERHLCQLDVFERVVQLVKREGIQTKASVEAFYEERMLNCLRKAIAADALTPNVCDAFKRAIALHRQEVLADPNASKGLKLRMRATLLGPKAYAVLNRIYPS